MRHALMITAALALAAGVSTTAAPRLDLNGRCRAPNGAFVKTEACKPTKTEPGGAHHLYLRNGQGVCHDEKGKVANPAACKR